MKREAFGEWLGRKGISTVTLRRSLATRVERALTTLGYASNDLDEAFAADELAGALSQLQTLGRTLSPGEPLPILLPSGSRNPSSRLTGMAAALRNYRDFAAGKPAVPDAEDAQKEAVWLVTARHGDEDGLAGFVERGEWSLVYEGRYSQKVREMQPGDRIVMRDYRSRSVEPPFETNGAGVSSMVIRAIGTITQNRNDGLSVAVDWDEISEPRTWYFYTNNETVWRLPENEHSIRLITFLLDREEQDYAWYLARPYWRDRLSSGGSDADRIRRHALEEFIEPARARGDASVTIGVRAVNEALGLKDGWPNICQALEGRKFLEMAALAPPTRIGKPISSATSFRFLLAEASIAWSPDPTNLILYGPPGTGKTYATAREAVRLCTGMEMDDSDPVARAALMVEYERLVGTGQIAFVTFHQSYAYEDFVEGLRPPSGGEAAEGGPGFRLDVRPGRFREIATLAEQARKRASEHHSVADGNLAGRRFWKMGLGAIGTEDDVYQACIDGKFVALGWGGDLDWSDPRFSSLDAMRDEWQVHFAADQHPDDQQPSQTGQTWTFRNAMKDGDIVIVPYGNTAFRAIGQVTGEYYFERSDLGTYSQRRQVRWLLTLDEPLPLDLIIDGKFTMRTLYEIDDTRIRHAALERLLGGADDGSDNRTPDQFVLVIDEINRANISKVFGELITLIEPDKRLGRPNALTVKLPYSPGDFGVPANLHILGTMNTADRSIALLDTALRRRFDFKELMPEPEKLAEAAKRTGIDLVTLLGAINDRIEYLHDREHQIGHAFFMPCITRNDVDLVLRRKVIPLLQEYFYEDWEKVAQALGDGEAVKTGQGRFLTRKVLAPPPGVEDQRDERWRWTIRPAFDLPLLNA